jgi:hypothetical protein
VGTVGTTIERKREDGSVGHHAQMAAIEIARLRRELHPDGHGARRAKKPIGIVAEAPE